MPFVQRVITPKYISRSTSRLQQNNGDEQNIGCSTSCVQALPVKDNELEAVTNVTLSNALRQLASLLLTSKEIFDGLNVELQLICSRTQNIKSKINNLQAEVDKFDPKLVPVPEGDLVSFVQIKNHYKSKNEFDTKLFTVNSRSETMQKLYEAAAKTPVPTIEQLDKILGIRGRRSSDSFVCTPVLGQLRRRIKKNDNIEIETRMPAAVDELRKWTSYEAIGDITVTPDCLLRVKLGTSQSRSPNETVSENEIEDCTDNVNGDAENGEPIDHRLPSPEEQCIQIAQKYPAQTVTVNVSGRHFDRMSAARKSLMHIQCRPNEPEVANGDTIVRRRSKHRKLNGKRRNTIAGIDQKEIEKAAGNESESQIDTIDDDKATYVPRSKSSDIWEKDLLTDFITTKRTSSHFNLLKNWGKNRLRMINQKSNQQQETNKKKTKFQDIDDFNISEATGKNSYNSNKKNRKLLHERKPSYSSSEKSLTAKENSPPQVIATINPVKFRETSTVRRQRRSLGLATKDEPHSSSGNWSASSDRTSIGSEITNTTVHPKSSASSTSLNHNIHQPSSGPPSSIVSRRKFLNTSASSSITSEETATPELRMFDCNDEGETSSVYSCDTEGYYTSFHVDSGLKTLKEEESSTIIYSSTALSSTTSFESSGNQTVISPENEYEIFGRGSTSTTASSAGTVCTAVLSQENEKYTIGPRVPERDSSLVKLKSSSNSINSSTLESCSSSTTSTLKNGVSSKRNDMYFQKKVSVLVHHTEKDSELKKPDSIVNSNSFSSESKSTPSVSQGMQIYSEFEHSENSDIECIDRIERIRVKTTINTSRIPSMCIITPTPSDDESTKQKMEHVKVDPHEITIRIKNNDLKLNKQTGYATVLSSSSNSSSPEYKKEHQIIKKATLLPLNNVFSKLKGVLNPLMKSSNKENVYPETDYDIVPESDVGEYVTIKDVNNKKKPSSGVYYSNDIVKRNLATVLTGNLNNEETEYVSLNELPCNIKCESHLLVDNKSSDENVSAVEEKIDNINYENVDGEKEYDKKMRGARVTLDAHGKVVFSSDSLKRRKRTYTTFSPGPFVKENNSNIVDENFASPFSNNGIYNRKLEVVRPAQKSIQSSSLDNAPEQNIQTQLTTSNSNAISNNNSPNLGVVLQNTTAMQQPTGSTFRGAYVNIQDAAPLRNGPPMYTPPGVYCEEDNQTPFYDNYRRGQPYRNDLPQFSTNLREPPYCNNDDWTSESNTWYNRNAIDEDEEFDKTAVDYSHPNEDYGDMNSSPVKSVQDMAKDNANDLFTSISALTNRVDLNEDNPTSTLSPIEPRNGRTFSTSTPQKDYGDGPASYTDMSLTNDLRSRLKLQDSGIRSHGNSPLNSGRSTPKGIFEASRSRHSWSSNNAVIPQTCSDRLGTSKTSLMDFKKLLLNKSTTPRPGKISAVEQLKLAKAQVKSLPSTPPNGKMDILELSGSPKTFATRRMIRQGHFGAKSGNSMSPSKSLVNATKQGGKHARRFQNMKTDVISTAIPEVQSEEDNSSPNASSERTKAEMKISPESSEKAETLTDYSKLEKNALNTIYEEKTSNIKDNRFLKEEENNFTKTEIQEQKKSTLSQLYTRAQIQQQRAQFLLANTKTNTQVLNNNNNNNSFLNNNNKAAQFKNGHYQGIVMTNATQDENPTASSDFNQSSETPVTATSKSFNTNCSGNEVIPSLETAL